MDVLVAGAGTTGAAVARACARRGLRVRCIDRGPLDQAGARWVNGVPAWAFGESGLDEPTAPERRADGGRFHMLAGWGPQRITVDARGLLEVDMRLLVARLQQEAQEAGAVLEGHDALIAVTPTRPGARVQTARGILHAKVVVDATGLAGLSRPTHLAVDRSELCAAAQQVHAIADRQAAEAWCRSHGVEPGDTLCFTGVAGGYSIINVRVESLGADPHVSILTGSIPAAGHPSGQALLDRFLAEHPWVGAKSFGGSRAIPSGTPAASLADGPVITLGDAGAQVFAAHGSGIAAGADRCPQLADSLAQGATQGSGMCWQRGGAHLAGANHFARFSRSLDAEAVAAAMRSGLMPASLARQTLLQHPTRPRPADLARMLRGARQERALALRFLPVVTTMLRLEQHQRRYPSRPGALATWSERRDQLFGLR